MAAIRIDIGPPSEYPNRTARSRAGGVHHGQHVVHPGLQVRQVVGPVRHAGAALVEADQPAERAQPVEEGGVPRIGPVELQVGDEPGHQHDVPLAAPGDLVRDLQAVADRVVDRLVPGRGRRPGLAGRSDEPVAAAVHGPDEPLGLPVVADRLAGLLDPAGDRGLADEPPTPDVVHQLFLGHHPVAVVHQVGEHLEDLRLDRHPYAGAPQLDLREVELQVLEGDDHSSTLTRHDAARNRYIMLAKSYGRPVPRRAGATRRPRPPSLVRRLVFPTLWAVACQAGLSTAAEY